jgi:hypothetical protein
MSASQAPLMDISTGKTTAPSFDFYWLEVLQRSYKILQSLVANVHPILDYSVNRDYSKSVLAADTPKQL